MAVLVVLGSNIYFFIFKFCIFCIFCRYNSIGKGGVSVVLER